jgi:hypothetical protein
MFAAIHFAHILTGVVWAGSTFCISLAFYPMLARMPAPEAKAVWSRFAPLVGPVIGVASGLTLLFGLIRAWIGGGIASFADLGSPYGLLVIAALALAVIDGAVGGRGRAKLERLLDDPAAYAAEGAATCRNNAIFGAVIMTGIILIMVTLGLGLY